jgi:hypothetical protein
MAIFHQLRNFPLADIHRLNRDNASQASIMIATVPIEVRKIPNSKQQWAESRPILRGMGLILLAVGFFLLVNGFYSAAQKYRRIRQWTPVDAVVLDFKVVNEASRRVSNGYRVHFTFQYEVQGRRLVGWTQTDHTGSYSSELSDWRQYQPGRHQQIRYNPAQPPEITIDDLNARSFRQPLKLVGWAAGLILIGLVFKK